MRRQDGQMAVFDAIAFLTIMLVASSLMFSYSASLSKDARHSQAADDISFAQSMLQALLRSDVANASYESNGSVILRGGPVSVEILLLEELSLVEDGVPRASFEGGWNAQVIAIGDSLSGQRQWSLNASYAEGSYQIGGERGRGASAASIEVPMISGVPGRATITLYVWRD